MGRSCHVWATTHDRVVAMAVAGALIGMPYRRETWRLRPRVQTVVVVVRKYDATSPRFAETTSDEDGAAVGRWSQSVSISPPSTRIEAPVVADAKGEAR